MLTNTELRSTFFTEQEMRQTIYVATFNIFYFNAQPLSFIIIIIFIIIMITLLLLLLLL